MNKGTFTRALNRYRVGEGEGEKGDERVGGGREVTRTEGRTQIR